MHPDVSHLQGKDGGDRFVVTDSILHVTLVVVLCHFGPAGQPRNRATLSSAQSWVGRCSGSQAPQDPVRPSWFTLLSTGRGSEREWRRRGGEKGRYFHALSERVWVLLRQALWYLLSGPFLASQTLCRMYLFQHQICRWEGISAVLLGIPLKQSHCLWPYWAVSMRNSIRSLTHDFYKALKWMVLLTNLFLCCPLVRLPTQCMNQETKDILWCNTWLFNKFSACEMSNLQSKEYY